MAKRKATKQKLYTPIFSKIKWAWQELTSAAPEICVYVFHHCGSVHAKNVVNKSPAIQNLWSLGQGKEISDMTVSLCLTKYHLKSLLSVTRIFLAVCFSLMGSVTKSILCFEQGSWFWKIYLLTWWKLPPSILFKGSENISWISL